MKVVLRLCILILAGCVISCVQESNDNDEVEQQAQPEPPGSEDALLEGSVSDMARINGRVFRHLIGIEDGQDSRPGIEIGAYYLLVKDIDEGWRDPDQVVMEHLSGFSKPVKGFSKCRTSSKGVWDLEDGRRGIQFSIDMVLRQSDTEVQVEASITLHGYNAKGYTYQLQKQGERWVISEVVETWVS